MSYRPIALPRIDFTVAGKLRKVKLTSRVTINNSDTMADLARQGYCLIQAPRCRFADDLARGTLIEVLAATPPSPTPLIALYPQNRQLAPRVRVFLDWVAGLFGPSI